MTRFSPQYSRFERLMRYRVREVLLVSSEYDHFILEEEGRLNELLLLDYRELNLSTTPRITHVRTAEEALEMVVTRPFDIIITMARVGDMKVHEFGNKVKALKNDISVILLAYNTRELAFYEEGDGIDRVFVWSGDSRILLAIIKSVEDKRNLLSDIREGDVQTILLVEDSVRYYSRFLPLLYHELMLQTTELMGNELNLRSKLLRMRARAKVILATSWEEAIEILDNHMDNVLGLVTDASFPRAGEIDPMAGVKLMEYVRSSSEYIPMMMQSTDAEHTQDAERVNATFISKDDPKLLNGVKSFLHTGLGFGSFEFSMPNGVVVGEARDLEEMRSVLPGIPEESIRFHAEANHFSNWFRARTEFNLAAELRPRTVSEFEGIEALKTYLIDIISEFLSQSRIGNVDDFSQIGRAGSGFIRFGNGSLGGKGRGLAFFHHQMPRWKLEKEFSSCIIGVPDSAVVATDFFDEFMEKGDLRSLALSELSDAEKATAFLSAEMPKKLVDDLVRYLREVNHPLAVRSSSLLEDSQHQPFAGVYDTYMVPNQEKSLEWRVEQLIRAIKLVWASTYYQASRDYIAATPNSIEEEKMAVVLQQLIGEKHGERFYPTFSGVARSYNFYPIGEMKPEEGMVAIALGLGRTVVEGEKCLRFSPHHPNRLYQFSTTEMAMNTTQREFWALDLSSSSQFVENNTDIHQLKLGLESAVEDGQLRMIGSTYSPENDVIREGISPAGIPVVSFSSILSGRNFPLALILAKVLHLTQSEMNNPAEVEFAVQIGEGGAPSQFALLQVRPLIAEVAEDEVDLSEVTLESTICQTSSSLGNGVIDGIKDIVYVHPKRMDRGMTYNVASRIEAINKRLLAQKRPYVLIGPGRWGSSDPWLGIPVKWGGISGARCIVECDLSDMKVEPSQGTHFFQNIVSFGVGYLTATGKEATVDFDWLDDQNVELDDRCLRHVILEKPVRVLLDGKKGRGVILKDGLNEPSKNGLNEQDS